MKKCHCNLWRVILTLIGIPTEAQIRSVQNHFQNFLPIWTCFHNLHVLLYTISQGAQPHGRVCSCTLLSLGADTDTIQRAVKAKICVVPAGGLLSFLALYTCGCTERSLLQPIQASLAGRTPGEIWVFVCLSYGKISLKPRARGQRHSFRSRRPSPSFPIDREGIFLKERNCSAVQAPLSCHRTANPSNQQVQSMLCLRLEQGKRLENSSARSAMAGGGIWKHQMLDASEKHRES